MARTRTQLGRTLEAATGHQWPAQERSWEGLWRRPRGINGPHKNAAGKDSGGGHGASMARTRTQLGRTLEAATGHQWPAQERSWEGLWRRPRGINGPHKNAAGKDSGGGHGASMARTRTQLGRTLEAATGHQWPAQERSWEGLWRRPRGINGPHKNAAGKDSGGGHGASMARTRTQLGRTLEAATGHQWPAQERSWEGLWRRPRGINGPHKNAAGKDSGGGHGASMARTRTQLGRTLEAATGHQWPAQERSWEGLWRRPRGINGPHKNTAGKDSGGGHGASMARTRTQLGRTLEAATGHQWPAQERSWEGLWRRPRGINGPHKNTAGKDSGGGHGASMARTRTQLGRTLEAATGHQWPAQERSWEGLWRRPQGINGPHKNAAGKDSGGGHGASMARTRTQLGRTLEAATGHQWPAQEHSWEGLWRRPQRINGPHKNAAGKDSGGGHGASMARTRTQLGRTLEAATGHQWPAQERSWEGLWRRPQGINGPHKNAAGKDSGGGHRASMARTRTQLGRTLEAATGHQWPAQERSWEGLWRRPRGINGPHKNTAGKDSGGGHRASMARTLTAARCKPGLSQAHQIVDLGERSSDPLCKELGTWDRCKGGRRA
ncbi:hypothetical protein P7K49_012939 [Saguinus oedipus]|uniref:Uncharacterized protein n=1 Tax=Saguinus oedipus TaxID=9490 RepID=A0ABQ9VEH1_SAGOE|nr:hypothetical protein P7K49_012939 [Saguinus oedipus]